MLFIIFEIAILFAILIAAFLCICNSREYLKSIDKREHKLYFFYPLADWLIDRTPLGILLNRRSGNSQGMQALNRSAKVDQLHRLFLCSKISLVVVIILFFDFLSLFNCAMNSVSSDILNEKYLLRPDYGDGTKEVDLNVSMEQKGDKKSGEKKADISKNVKIQVEERAYTSKELEIIFSKAVNYLEKEMLGENKSKDEIYYDLNFIHTIPGTSITVDWEPEDYNLIGSDGSVRNEKVPQKGVVVKVTAILNYHEQQKKHLMNYRIMPKQYSEDEVLNNKLEDKLSKSSKETPEKRLLKLPDTLGNYHLTWHDKEKDNGLTLWFIGIILAVAAWIMGDKELENKMKKRKDQMLLDYPELINRFTLLINAGMTIRQAWNKISDDYSRKLSQEKGDKRYAYEEMLTTANELKLGLPENVAYEQYGRRVGLIPYIKFSSLISQNLRKGNKGFTELLMKEAMEAFEERKEVAKRLGEEAGTKLLIPMMLMLLMVLLIIMIPAFWAFRM